VLTLWAVVWKGFALWRAARHGQKYWYIGLLVLNTIGIVEIIYLFFFQKEGRLVDRFMQKSRKRSSSKKKKKSSKSN
jgi:hypothetical protein